MSLDQHIQSLFKVSNIDSVNEYIKGFYCSGGLDMTQFSVMRIRKGHLAASSGLYVNQLSINGVLVYSKGYATQPEALANLPVPLITESNGISFCILIDWDALPCDDYELNFPGCIWRDVTNPVANLEMAAHLFKMKKLEITSNPMPGWPSVPNARIRYKNTAIAQKQLINNDENMILDTASPVSQFIIGRENVVIQDSVLGQHSIFETTNTDYGDINIVRKRVLNPYYEETVHRNASFLDIPDGARTMFYLPDFLCSETELSIYRNGLRLQLGTDYQTYPEHDLVIFTTPPVQSDVLICDFLTKREHFYVNTSFNGVSVIDSGQILEGKRVLYLDGIDSEYPTDNNFALSRHGFHPMQFLMEGNGETISIVNAPSGAFDGQKALQYNHGFASSGNADCSRTECIIASKIGANRIISEVEIFIPSDVGSCLNSACIGNFDWLTLQEYWEGRTESLVGGEYNDQIEHRLTLGMLKTTGCNHLHFELWSEDIIMEPFQILPFDKKLISSVNIPFGTWFKLHVEIVPGDSSHGKFIMTMIESDGTTTEIFADTEANRLRTVCPRQCRLDGNYNLRLTKRPVFESFSTMKLYTSVALKNAMIEKGHPLRIYFRNHHLDCVCAVQD